MIESCVDSPVPLKSFHRFTTPSRLGKLANLPDKRHFARGRPHTLWTRWLYHTQTHTHTHTLVHTFEIQRRMPKNAECLETKGEALQRRPLRCKLLTNTCLSCTVHSRVSHLSCPGAVEHRRAHLAWRDLSGHLRINRSPRSFHDTSPCASRRRALVLSDHTDWPPVVLCFPGAELPLWRCWHPSLRPAVWSRQI